MTFLCLGFPVYKMETVIICLPPRVKCARSDKMLRIASGTWFLLIHDTFYSDHKFQTPKLGYIIRNIYNEAKVKPGLSVLENLPHKVVRK